MYVCMYVCMYVNPSNFQKEIFNQANFRELMISLNIEDLIWNMKAVFWKFHLEANPDDVTLNSLHFKLAFYFLISFKLIKKVVLTSTKASICSC